MNGQLDPFGVADLRAVFDGIAIRSVGTIELPRALLRRARGHADLDKPRHGPVCNHVHPSFHVDPELLVVPV